MIKKFPCQIVIERLISDLTFFWFSPNVCSASVEYSCPPLTSAYDVIWWYVHYFFGGREGRRQLHESCLGNCFLKRFEEQDILKLHDTVCSNIQQLVHSHSAQLHIRHLVMLYIFTWNKYCALITI
jgi:hypothetical protein